MTDNLPPLLPCPFCGGAPKTLERPDNIDGTEFVYAVSCYCDGYSARAHQLARCKTPEQAKAAATSAWNRRAVLAQAQSLPAERIEELEILAARWTQLEYMYGRGIAPDTIAHYIGRPERLDYLVKMRIEYGSLAASPQPQPVQPSERWHIGDSAFESWFSSYSPAGKGDKQRARDAYAAGMGELAQVVQAKSEQAAQQWTPIETAPRGRLALLWSENSKDVSIDDFELYCRFNQPKFSHWMPLPAAPQPKD